MGIVPSLSPWVWAGLSGFPRSAGFPSLPPCAQAWGAALGCWLEAVGVSAGRKVPAEIETQLGELSYRLSPYSGKHHVRSPRHSWVPSGARLSPPAT